MARSTFGRGTWLDPEELAYSSRSGSASGSRRKFRAVATFPGAAGELVQGYAGVPDTYFSIPAFINWKGKRTKGFLHIGGISAGENEDVLLFTIPRSGNPRRPRRTRRRMGLIKDVRFFRSHAGGVVGEATKGALDLTRAEREMEKRGWTVEWVPDDDADWSWLDQPGFEKEKAKEHEVYGAILRDKNGNVLASLWGIFDPDRHYTRVVEAELASEALSK